MGTGSRLCFAAAWLLLAALTSACGSRVAPEERAVTGAAATAPTTQASEPSAPQAPDAPPAPAPPAEGGLIQETSPQPAEAPEREFMTQGEVERRHNNGYVRIELSASCVTPASPLTVTLRGGANAGVSAIIGYADESSHGSMIVGNADQSGTYVWRVVVPLDAPTGDAKLLASMTGPDWEGEGGTADQVFRVVTDKRECP